MRRLPRVSVRVGAAVAVAALCAAVAVLAATGTFSGSTTHAKLTAEQRLHSAVRAELAHLLAAQRAAERVAEKRARARAAAPTHDPADRYSGAVRIATKRLGVPYVWGGASPRGFDASGLVMYVYRKLGVTLPHWTLSQYAYPHSVRVARSQLKPGDLVFFAGLEHVGIYIGDNEFIHAPHTGAVVRVESLTGRYSSEYYGATRILG